MKSPKKLFYCSSMIVIIIIFLCSIGIKRQTTNAVNHVSNTQQTNSIDTAEQGQIDSTYETVDKLENIVHGTVNQIDSDAIKVPHRNNDYITEVKSNLEPFYVAGNHATAIYKCTDDKQQLIYQAERPSVIRSIQKGKEYVFFLDGSNLYRFSESDGQCSIVMECVHTYFIADNLIYLFMDTDFSLRVLDGFEEHLNPKTYIQICDRVHSVVPTATGVIYGLTAPGGTREEIMQHHMETGEVHILDNSRWGLCSFANDRVFYHNIEDTVDGQYIVTWYDLTNNKTSYATMPYVSKEPGNRSVRMVTIENSVIYLLLYSGEVISAPLENLQDVTYWGCFSLDTYGILDFGVSGNSVYLTAQAYDTGVYGTEIIKKGNSNHILIK